MLILLISRRPCSRPGRRNGKGHGPELRGGLCRRREGANNRIRRAVTVVRIQYFANFGTWHRSISDVKIREVMGSKTQQCGLHAREKKGRGPGCPVRH